MSNRNFGLTLIIVVVIVGIFLFYKFGQSQVAFVDSVSTLEYVCENNYDDSSRIYECTGGCSKNYCILTQAHETMTDCGAGGWTYYKTCGELGGGTIVCTDSDGGISPAVGGYVTKGEQISFDYCIDSDSDGYYEEVGEYYCSGTSVAIKQEFCGESEDGEKCIPNSMSGARCSGCTPDEKRCYSLNMEMICNSDREWVYNECPSGERCNSVSGECESTIECDDGDRECYGLDRYQICDDGEWQRYFCQTGETCENGYCGGGSGSCPFPEPNWALLTFPFSIDVGISETCAPKDCTYYDYSGVVPSLFKELPCCEGLTKEIKKSGTVKYLGVSLGGVEMGVCKEDTSFCKMFGFLKEALPESMKQYACAIGIFGIFLIIMLILKK